MLQGRRRGDAGGGRRRRFDGQGQQDSQDGGFAVAADCLPTASVDAGVGSEGQRGGPQFEPLGGGADVRRGGGGTGGGGGGGSYGQTVRGGEGRGGGFGGRRGTAPHSTGGGDPPKPSASLDKIEQEEGDEGVGSMTTLADQVAAAQAKRSAAIQAARSTGNLGLDWGLGSPPETVDGGIGGGYSRDGVGVTSATPAPSVMPAAPVVAAATGALSDDFVGFDAVNTTEQWVDFGGGGSLERNQTGVGATQMMPTALARATRSPPLASPPPPPSQDPGDALAAALGMLTVAGASRAPAESPPPTDPFGDLLS